MLRDQEQLGEPPEENLEGKEHQTHSGKNMWSGVEAAQGR